MKYLAVFLWIGMIGLFACQSGDSTPTIEDLETQFAESNSAADAKSLLDAYEAYIEANPQDVSTNAGYLEKAAQIQFNGKQFQTSTDILLQALRTYHNAPNAPQMAKMLGDIYETNLEKPALAQTVWQGMQAGYPNNTVVNLKEKLGGLSPIQERMDTMLFQMTNLETGQIRFPVANTYLNSAEVYAAIAPQAAETPGLLYKGGEIARLIGMFDRALDLYEWVEEKYPNYSNASKALFMRAFTLEEDLKRTEDARALYQLFLQKYPEDDFADDAQILLDNLGKTEEEILQQFQNNSE